MAVAPAAAFDCDRLSMSLPPPLPVSAQAQARDASDLRLVSILMYVHAGLQGLVLLLLAAFLVFGIHHESLKNHAGQAARDTAAGQAIIVVLAALIAISLAVLVLKCVAARYLTKRRGHTLCMVAAVITCLDVPIGTGIGVYALVVLQRPSVKALFGAG